MSSEKSKMWSDRTWTDLDGIEHQRAGYVGCLCGWDADIGKSVLREFDKHVLQAMSKESDNV